MAGFRARTWIRERSPAFIAERIPKGRDCGDHEWYLSSDGHWACYHCLQETTTPPSEAPDWARLRLQAINSDLAVLLASPGISGAEIASEIDRYAPEVEELQEVLGAEPSESQERFPLQPQSAIPIPTH